jgi:hypothetical protein
MVDGIYDKPVTLGAMILKTQKKAAVSLQNPLSAALTNDEAGIADQISLSEGARNKLASARKVDGYLRIFSSFLKLLNAPQYGLKPVKPGFEQSPQAIEKRFFQRDI